ncbi:hypothetical protein SCHPADRAFT_894760 [Schizopora paradoxa]|uniref:N-acetyltransferase domain-containing protein n=1 Tax=Schizopora paradoxa TaxID=27342 RepID=A0A0H2RR48_9AGAM|nr:hypothetical protein SCHPADRAFT_894760 [Schizopora paradoxa]
MLPYKCDVFDLPGLSWTPSEVRDMVIELRSLASTCFPSLPDYQCLSLSNLRCLDDKVLVVARCWDTNEIVAFTSAVYYEVPDVGTVLHTGLTCVHPSVRRSGFTSFLFSHLIPHVLKSYPSGIWMSNLSEIPCTLVGILSITSHVFPSLLEPFPSPTHVLIAKTLTSSYRHHINAPPEATLDASTFVFKDSRPPGSPFRTNPFDPDLQHRKKVENEYYRSMLKKEGGDDVLQVAFLDPLKVAKSIQARRTTVTHSIPEDTFMSAKL